MLSGQTASPVKFTRSAMASQSKHARLYWELFSKAHGSPSIWRYGRLEQGIAYAAILMNGSGQAYGLPGLPRFIAASPFPSCSSHPLRWESPPPSQSFIIIQEIGQREWSKCGLAQGNGSSGHNLGSYSTKHVPPPRTGSDLPVVSSARVAEVGVEIRTAYNQMRRASKQLLADDVQSTTK